MYKDSLAPDILQKEVFPFFHQFSEKGSERTDEMGTDLWRTSGPKPAQAGTAGAGFPGPGPVELSVSPRVETAQTPRESVPMYNQP